MTMIDRSLTVTCITEYNIITRYIIYYYPIIKTTRIKMQPHNSNRSTENQSSEQQKLHNFNYKKPITKSRSQHSQLSQFNSQLKSQFKSQSQIESQLSKLSEYGSKYRQIQVKYVQEYKQLKEVDLDNHIQYHSRVSVANKISFKIVVIGQSFVGKTSLIQRFVNNLPEDGNINQDSASSTQKDIVEGSFKSSQKNQFLAVDNKPKKQKQYSATVGVEFSSRCVFIQDTKVQIQIWDTCGHDLFRSVTTSFYRGACGVFLVFALNNRKSFQKIQFWYEQFQQNGSPEALVIIIGTKSDLQHEVAMQQGLQLMKKLGGLFYVQTSAETGEQIQQLFNMTAELMYKKFKISHKFRVLAQPRKHNKSSILINDFDEKTQKQPNSGINTSRIRLTSLNKKRTCC